MPEYVEEELETTRAALTDAAVFRDGNGIDEVSFVDSMIEIATDRTRRD